VNGNIGKVVELGPHSNMSVADTLALCQREAASYQEVLVIAIGPNGGLITRSSGMARKDAFWLAHQAADHAFKGG
jgi:hypothetical protein